MNILLSTSQRRRPNRHKTNSRTFLIKCLLICNLDLCQSVCDNVSFLPPATLVWSAYVSAGLPWQSLLSQTGRERRGSESRCLLPATLPPEHGGSGLARAGTTTRRRGTKESCLRGKHSVPFLSQTPPSTPPRGRGGNFSTCPT